MRHFPPSTNLVCREGLEWVEHQDAAVGFEESFVEGERSKDEALAGRGTGRQYYVFFTSKLFKCLSLVSPQGIVRVCPRN